MTERSFPKLCKMEYIERPSTFGRGTLYCFHFDVLEEEKRWYKMRPTFEKFRDDLRNDTQFAHLITIEVAVCAIMDNETLGPLDIDKHLYELDKVIVTAITEQDAVTFKMKYLT